MSVVIHNVVPMKGIDGDAVAIGTLYRNARARVSDAVRCLIEAGQKLREKQKAVGRGGWDAWLEANEEALGFGRRTAYRLLKIAKSDVNDTLDEIVALKILRSIWGNYSENGVSETDDDFLSPEEADEAIEVIAKRASHELFAPSPGILACLVEAMARTGTRNRAAITKAAIFFSTLAGNPK